MILQSKAHKEKKKVGPTKAEIVSKFLEDLKESSDKKKYTLNDLVAKRRGKQSKMEGGDGEVKDVPDDTHEGNGDGSTVPTLKQVATELHKIMV